MAIKPLRFGVGDATGKRAATWNLTVRDRDDRPPEIYLSCRELGGTIHTSFHSSGRWHTGFTKTAFEALIKEVADPGADRFIQKWLRPPEIQPGVTLAFRILTPWTTVTSDRREGDDKVVPIAKPKEGNAIETFVAITASTVEVDVRQLVGHVPFSNGGKVIVFAKEKPMPSIVIPPSASGRFVKGKGKEDLRSDTLRAMVFADDDKGCPMIVEYIVKPQRNSTG